MQGMESPAKMKLSVSGCPRNCAESYVKDVGIVAIEGGRWEIYIGGAAGAHVRKGDLLATVDDAETAKKLTARFLQYYRENGKWLERTYAFVPRIGLDRIKAVVVEDSDGIAERLDAAVQEHVDSYVDPWSDQGADPMTPGQFRTSLPLEVLPTVPADRAEQLLGGAW
jgi:nitrite reductase (NADH) large subunit